MNENNLGLTVTVPVQACFYKNLKTELPYKRRKK